MHVRDPFIAQSLGEVRATLERIDGALVVACSGGPDSMALLGLVSLLVEPLALEVAVTHVDHGLRRESAEEGELVARTAARLGLRFFAGGRLELAPGPGLAARARDQRRARLCEVAACAGASWIALGHTATDQVETILLHLVRGAGLDGLSGMPAMESPFVRPVLHLGRDDTRRIAERMELGFVDDPTNECLEHPRVALRKEVLPRLRLLNPRLERAIGTSARQLADADRALDTWAAGECESRRCDEATWFLTEIERLPRAVRTRFVRAVCGASGVDLSELRGRVVDGIDDAMCGMAERTMDGAGRPRTWDLHPERRLRIAWRDGRLRLSIERAASMPNH